MKKIFSGLIILLLVLCVASCGFAQNLKSIELVYSNNAPAQAGGNVFFEKTYLAKINKEIEQFGYKLDVTMYHASSLYKYQDQVNALEKGLIEITNFIANWEEARAPLHQVVSLPMMGFTPQSHARIWTELQENIPAFAKEVGKYQELFHISTAPGIFNMNEVRRVPEDFRGVKVYATGIVADFFKSIGASPLRIDAPDWYSSLDRGMIDMLPLGAFIINMWKIDEVAKVHVIPTGDAPNWVTISYIMNRRAFDGLPKEVQKVIKDNVGWASQAITGIDDENDMRSKKKFEEEGNTVVYLNPAEVEKWRQAAIPIHNAWINKMEGMGLPGQEVYDETVRLIKKYK